MANLTINEHDAKLLRILASDFRIQYDENNKGWYLLKKNQIIPELIFDSFESAVDYIFDKGLLENN